MSSGGEEELMSTLRAASCSSWAAGSKIRQAWDHAVIVVVAILAGPHAVRGYGEIQWANEPLASDEFRRTPQRVEKLLRALFCPRCKG